jgi:hypothetical protein
MKTPALLTLIVCVFGLASVSQAAQMIASPVIFSASYQIKAECFIRNIGTTQVSVGVSIVNESGSAIAGTSSCLAPLAAGASCSVSASIGNAAYACSATTSGSAKNLRGILIVGSNRSTVLR